MEFGVRQFRWHDQFHGIPWNFMELGVLECANFDDTSSSMEFHGTWGAPILLTPAVPWNSMELGVRQLRWHEQFHGIPWNLECANFDDTSSSMEFHGTWSSPISMTRAVPWDLEFANFVDTSSSMEFHGTSRAPISMTPVVSWNSLEFHGTWSAPISLTRAVPWNSMELGVRQFRWHQQFRGVPWDLECANFDDTSSPMEFHGTWSAPISLTREVPWNSMELGVRQIITLIKLLNKQSCFEGSQQGFLYIVFDIHPWHCDAHNMETFSAVIALCEGNLLMTGVCPTLQSFGLSFGVVFDLRRPGAHVVSL